MTLVVRKNIKLLPGAKYAYHDFLNLAINSKNSQFAQLLIEKAEVDIHEIDRDGRAPIHHAALNGLTSVVHILVSKGAMNKRSHKWPCSPIFYAVRCGHLDVLKCFVEYAKEDLNLLRDQNGMCLLSAAITTGEWVLKSVYISIYNVCMSVYISIYNVCMYLCTYM